jgi:TonB family protein
MANPTDKGYFVELGHFSILLARSSALRSPLAIEDIREVPLDNKAGLEEAVQAVFPETKSGNANVFAALRPKQQGLYLSNADEAKKFATLATLSGILTEPALASLSPCEFTAVNARDGLTISGQGTPWILAAAGKEGYAQALSTLQELKLAPDRISPATLSAAGGLASALKLKGDSSTVLLFEFAEISTHLLLVSSNGVEAVRTTPVTMDKVAEAVQVELGLKFKGSAAKLFFNDSYDFSETGAKIAARIAQELTADVGALGHSPAAFTCTGLPAKQSWFSNHLAGALNLAPFAPDLKSWCAQNHLTFSDSALESSLTPAWLGFLHFIGNYQVASPERSVWQPDWTRKSPPPAAAPAPAPEPAAVVLPAPKPTPAPVIAPPKPAPAAVIAPPKPAPAAVITPPKPPTAGVPPIAPPRPPVPPLFKPSTPAGAVPPAKPVSGIAPPKPAGTVPPTPPLKPASSPFTPIAPKPATPAAAQLPVKPTAPAAPVKPAAPPAAKPFAAPPPRPLAAPPPRPISSTPPPKPITAAAPAKPAPPPPPAKPAAPPPKPPAPAAKPAAVPAPKPATPAPAKSPLAAPVSSTGKTSFLKTPVGMVSIIAAVIVLGAVSYIAYNSHEVAVRDAQEKLVRQQQADEAARIKKIAEQKAQEEAAAKAAAAADAAKLAAAEAAVKAAEDKARFEEAAHIAAARGQINIATEPSGATITIDDLPTRTSPALFTNLKLGHYAVTIALPNYEPAKLDIEVKENETADPGVIKLIHQTGSLDLASDPPGVNYSVRSASSAFLISAGNQAANSTTIFNQTWADGTRSNQSPPASLAWYCSSPGSSVTVTNGSVSLSTGGSAARHLVAYFPRQKLTAGDSLTLTFDFSLAGPFQPITSSSSIGLKVGLFDSNGSYIFDSDNEQSSNPVTYTGYTSCTGLNLPGESSSGLLDIRKRNPVSGNLIVSNVGIYYQLPGRAPERQTWQPDVGYTGTLTIQAISETQVKISANYSGPGLNNYSITSVDRASGSNAVVNSFDTVAFGLPSVGGRTAAQGMTLSNVKLTYTTPGGGLSGTTPATLNDLPAGDYIVTFSREGFQPHTENVTVTHDTPAQVSWKFANGNLVITSDPAGASVTGHDGKPLGVTPLTINDILPGDVTYVLTLDGYDPFTLNGKVEGGKTVTLNAALLSVERLAKLSDLDTQPQAIVQAPPVLPSRISDTGEVKIDVTVDRSGNPKDLSVVENTTNNADIARYCLEAIAKWRFKPGTIDDKPVNVRITVPFKINP